MSVFEFTNLAPERLDAFLARVSGISRVKIQESIKHGLVLINNKKVLKPSTKLRPHDNVALVEEKSPKKSDELAPAPDLPIRIAFENKNLLVIEKPHGILAHPTTYDREGTVVNWLIAHYPNIKNVGDNPDRPGLVHRLDRDTSGLMVLAKTQESFLSLKKQFQERTVHKKYLALVVGIPKETSGIIDYPLSVSLGKTVRRVADRKRRKGTEAITHWKLHRAFENYALLEVEPKTGRTHQIRVHLAAIHHPVVGDPLYGGKLAMKLGLKRQFLHAYYLQFKDVDGEIIAVETPLPQDLEETLQRAESAPHGLSH